MNGTKFINVRLPAFGRAVLAACFLAAVWPYAASAQDTGSDTTASARVRIESPVSIEKTDDLDFGIITPGDSDGSVDIDPHNDKVKLKGGVVSVVGSPHAARFIVRGSPKQEISVETVADPVLTNENGDTMALSKVKFNGTAKPKLDKDGQLDLRVGATLDVAADQAGGDYSGEITVTVDHF